MVLVVAGAALTATRAPSIAGHTRTTDVTYQRDIAPILQSRCVACHQDRGIAAAVSLTTYEDARRWAPQIRDEVLGLRMPPWPAAEGIGDFVNRRSLSAIEMEMIAAWTAGGMPKGAGTTSKSPAAPPDRMLPVVVHRPVQDGSPAANAQTPFDSPVGQTKWISGWRLSPSGADSTQRVTISVGRRVLGVWVPGDEWVTFPRGIAVPVRDRDIISLAFVAVKGSGVSASVWTLSLRLGTAGMTPQYAEFGCGTYRVRERMTIVEFMPRAGAAAASIEGLGIKPDGSVLPLFAVPSFAPDDQPALRLRRPVALPPGTRLELRGTSTCSLGALFTSTGPGPAATREQ